MNKPSEDSQALADAIVEELVEATVKEPNDKTFKTFDLPKKECKYCTREFKTSNARKKHEEHCISSELSWKCNDCGKGYKTQGGLTWHQKKHQEIQKNYSCIDCHASYQSISELRKHCYLVGCAFPAVEEIGRAHV